MTNHNPIGLLHAALTTSRPELLRVFQGSMDALVESGEPMDPELVKGLTQALVSVSTEVYDLRRALNAIMEANRHIHQSIAGCQRHLDVAREIAVRGRAGNLPDHYCAGDIIAAIKKEAT